MWWADHVARVNDERRNWLCIGSHIIDSKEEERLINIKNSDVEY